MALTGLETLEVLGQSPAGGYPAATTLKTTTGAIAALASSDTSFVSTPITTVGNGVLTAAGLTGGQIVRTGPVANYTDTTDTAAAIAAIPGVIVGGTVQAIIKNATAFTQTLSAGVGVTLPTTVLIPPYSVGTYVMQIVSATAVTLLHGGTTPIATGQIVTAPAVTALTTVGAGTITAASFTTGITVRTGPTVAFTDTTDTAASIIAACANLIGKIGSAFLYRYENSSANVATLTGGVGVTVSGITVVTPNTTVEYLVTYTAAATITMVGLSSSASVTSSPQMVGSSLAITQAMANAPILLNTAGGSTATLPAATGSGLVYNFFVTTTATAAAHKILAASVSDFMNGIVTGENAGTAKCFASAAATNHSLQMPFAGTQPSGGFIGDWFAVTDIAVNLWSVKGMYQAGTTPTTPFSAATT